METLPEYVDTVIIGTGITECIIAASLARSGRQVLHIDTEGTYGSQNKSISLDQLLSWTNESNVDDEQIDKDGFNSVRIRSSDSRIRKRSVRENLGEFDTIHDRLRKYLTTQVSEDYRNQSKSPTKEKLTVDITDEEEEAKQLEERTTRNRVAAIMRNLLFDISPKILLARGQLVKTLVSSGVSRYCEFMPISNVMCCNDNSELFKAPLTRSAIFTDKSLSMVKKRLLMKFVTCCQTDLQKDNKTLEDLPVMDFLESKGLDTDLSSVVSSCLCMSLAFDELASIAVERAKKVLDSAGVYAVSPFLLPIYGSADIPQAFCRMAAVFGAVYHLHLDIDRVERSDSSPPLVHCNDNIQIRADYVVINGQYVESGKQLTVYRLILLATRPVKDCQNNENSLLHTFAHGGNRPVTVIETRSQHLSVIYVCARTPGDIDWIKERFNMWIGVNNILVEVRFEQVISTGCSSMSSSNVFITDCYGEAANNPIVHDGSVDQAESIFRKINPGEVQFLPKMPDAEDVIMEDENNEYTN